MLHPSLSSEATCSAGSVGPGIVIALAQVDVGGRTDHARAKASGWSDVSSIGRVGCVSCVSFQGVSGAWVPNVPDSRRNARTRLSFRLDRIAWDWQARNRSADTKAKETLEARP